MKSWQDRLKELLKQSPYENRTELCRVSGISPSTLSGALKDGYTPKKNTLEKLAVTLGTTVDYLLEGTDNESMVRVNEVPVLAADQIDDWLGLRLKRQTVNHRIRPPHPVSKLAFAWIVDTVDMSPFAFGSTVILEPDFDFKRRTASEHIYVLACKNRSVVHSVTMTDIEAAYERALANKKNQPVKPQYELQSIHVTLVKFAKTICGYELISSDPKSNRSLNINDYQIVGRVKYSINDY